MLKKVTACDRRRCNHDNRKTLKFKYYLTKPYINYNIARVERNDV